MEWSDQELADVMWKGAAEAPDGIVVSPLPAESLRSMMTRAVELVAARGSHEARLPTAAHPHFGAFPCSPACTHDDAKTRGHPERAKERSEATQMVISRADDRTTAAESAVYERGAEAMRAACLNATQFEMEKRGASREEWESMKAAIEGAMP